MLLGIILTLVKLLGGQSISLQHGIPPNQDMVHFSVHICLNKMDVFFVLVLLHCCQISPQHSICLNLGLLK